MDTIKRVKLFPNENQKSLEIAAKVEQLLNEKGFFIVDKDYQLGIAIGGDGSFLRMVKQSNFNSDIYYVGIHAGTLGFLQDLNVSDIASFLDKVKKQEFTVDYIGIQETKVKTQQNESRFYSLNDIAIRDKDLNTVKLDIQIDGVLLEHFAGDGILVATSVGSTAYNLSFGGSMVYHTLHTLQVTPIAPLHSKAYHNLVNSVVVPENKSITFLPQECADFIITVDGENNVYEGVEWIETEVKQKRIAFIRMKDYNFIHVIHEKLL